MNKKLLAAAIAATIAAPTAALANDVTIYGVIHASVDYLDFDASWSGHTLAYDGSDATIPYSWVPAIRNSAGSFTPLLQYQYDEEEGAGGFVPVVPSVSAMAGYFNYLDSLPGDRANGFDVVSRATRLGFKGTEDLANGLKAIWKIELQVDIADRGGSCAAGLDLNYSLGSPTLNQGNITGNCDSADFITARNAYVGLAGGWGTFLVGRHDTPFKMSTGKLDLFADTLADYNSTVGFVDIRTNSAIAYVSPSWSGLSFAGALVAPHVYSSYNSAGNGSYSYFDSNGDQFVVRKSSDADSLAEAYSLALTYDNAGFFASLAYENVSGDWWDAWTGGGLGFGQTGSAFGVVPATALAESWNQPGYGYNSDDSSKWRVGLGWTGAGFTIGGLYEWEDNVLGIKGADGERWQLQAGYTFGNNMIKAMYGQGDFNVSQAYSYANFNPDYIDAGRYREDGERTAWAIGLDHNFSKRTKAYVLYTAVEADTSQVYEEGWGSREADQLSAYGAKQKLNYDQGGFSIGMIHSF
jgi:predicted porin